jgi:hypothetical protein
MDYKPFLISVGKSGAYSDDMEYEDAFCTKEMYGLWIKHAPLTVAPKSKSPIRQSWLDEHGDDVWLPQEGIKHESYEYDVTFAYVEKTDLLTNNISKFVEKITGKWLKIYDTYTGMYRKGVYLESFDANPRFKRRYNNEMAILNVKFKCNFPPTTEIE